MDPSQKGATHLHPALNRSTQDWHGLGLLGPVSLGHRRFECTNVMWTDLGACSAYQIGRQGCRDRLAGVGLVVAVGWARVHLEAVDLIVRSDLEIDASKRQLQGASQTQA